MSSATSAATVRYSRLATAADAEPFREMTYRSYLPLLASLGSGPGVAVGAWRGSDGGEEAVGLALAQLDAAPDAAQVLSLFVAPDARHQGVGATLLAHLEEAVAGLGVPQVFGVYPSGKETTPHLEQLLAGRGWSPPRPRMYLFRACKPSFETIIQAPFLQATHFPPGYEMFPWRDHTPQERAFVLAGIADGRFPAHLSPFNEEAIVDPDVSLGLRYEGQLYGWMICHAIAPYTVRYTALYVREDIPIKGLGFRLFGQSLRRHLDRERGQPEVVGCWGVLASNPFATLLQRRLLPHLPDATYSLTQESFKVLLPSG